MELNRRNFLKGMAVAGAAAAGVALTGCSGEQPQTTSNEAVESSGQDWLGQAPGLKIEDCVETIETDVVVVGSALAGSASAFGAIRNGAKVIILERNVSNHVGGQEMSFLNSKWQLEQGVPEYNKIQVANTLYNQTQQRADMGLIAVWCNRSGEIFDELKEQVLDPYGCFYRANIIEDLYPDPDVEMTPYNSSGIAFSEKDDYLTDFLKKFHEWILDNGGEIHTQTRGEELVKDGSGRVIGIIATNPDGDKVYYKASKGVIMCTGSFGANEAMMREFFPEHFAEWGLNNNAYNAYMTENVIETLDDGLGHKMLCWAGAEMDDFIGYQSWAVSGWRGFPFLAVNQNGERFFNEATSLLTAAHIVVNQPGHLNYYWQIVPTNDYEMPCSFGLTMDMFMTMYGDSINMEAYTADTIEELAEMIHVDPDTLVATVNRYNELCAAGDDLDYMKAPRYMDAIDDPPYTAYKQQFPFFITSSGVKCNANLQVLDANGNAIPGLYAAGNTVGYRFGTVYQTYLHGGTNAYAMTHGYVAGEHAANN